jgi:hypothetical protein
MHGAISGYWGGEPYLRLMMAHFGGVDGGQAPMKPMDHYSSMSDVQRSLGSHGSIHYSMLLDPPKTVHRSHATLGHRVPIHLQAGGDFSPSMLLYVRKSMHSMETMHSMHSMGSYSMMDVWRSTDSRGSIYHSFLLDLQTTLGLRISMAPRMSIHPQAGVDYQSSMLDVRKSMESIHWMERLRSTG